MLAGETRTCKTLSVYKRQTFAPANPTRNLKNIPREYARIHLEKLSNKNWVN